MSHTSNSESNSNSTEARTTTGAVLEPEVVSRPNRSRFTAEYKPQSNIYRDAIRCEAPNGDSI